MHISWINEVTSEERIHRQKNAIAGVWGWAGVVLAAGADVPEADWATFMNEVASVWVKYAYPDGSLVLPRCM